MTQHKGALPTEDGTAADGADIVLLKGQVIYDSLEKKSYRILYLPARTAADNNIGYWICTDSPSNIPKAFAIDKLRLWLYGTRCETAVDHYFAQPPAKISDAAQKLRDRAYAAIEDLITTEPDIYDRKLRTALLQAAEKRTGVRFNQIYAYLGKYWRGGMTKNALLPDYAHIGTHRKTDYVPTKRLGRRAKTQGNNGKILTPADTEIFKAVIEKSYKSDTQPSLTEVYNTMLAHYYARARFKGDTNPEPLPPEQKPSYMQFYYWHKKHKDEIEETKSRLGNNKFSLTARGITGKSETTLNGPGMVYQIDATIADYYLVQANDRNALAGRPVIFFIRDVRSRMITGMYVSLENASCNSAKMALKNCAEDKVEFCRRYGIEITPEEWPCRHLPVSITGDNGEMAGYGIEDIISKLGITIRNTPPYRGDLKAVIETAFNLVNIRLDYLVPGHVDKDAGQRGSVDRRKEACVDLQTFIRLMIRTVLYYNNHWYMDQYQKTPQMREHHVRPIPRELWNYGMQYESGVLKTLAQDEINKVLLAKAQATVTENGIRFNDLYYTCPSAQKEQWFARARIGGRYKVPILFDPSCVDKIHIDDKERGLVACTLLSRAAMYSGATAEDMARNREEDARERAAYAQEGERAKTKLILEIETEIRRCKKAKNGETRNAVAGKMNSAKLRENRQNEKEWQSGKTAALEMQSGLPTDAGTAKSAGAKPGRKGADAIDEAIENTLKAYGFLKQETHD